MKNIVKGLVISLLLSAPLQVLAADTTRPVIGPASPDQATAGAPVTIMASASDDDSGIASCDLYVDNDDAGAMSWSMGIASKEYIFTQAGIHTIFVFCRDGANNFNSGPATSMTVMTGSGVEHTPPTIGTITPTTAIVGTPVILTTSVSDTGSGVAGCDLIVNGFSRGTMQLSSGQASLSLTFDTIGTYSVYAQCFDGAGNIGSGPATDVNVTIESASPSPVTVPAPPPLIRLIKLVCPTGAGVDDPCKAVYYQGSDGKRHAFPNSKVYFSWYQDFSGVVEVSADEMASLTLGKQVTYRPGYKLVKFTTVNNVYAVAKGGLLRWIKTEAAASDIYGGDWNKKVDDISDAFFPDYKFGLDINSAQDYSPSLEMSGAMTIDSNF